MFIEILCSRQTN